MSTLYECCGKVVNLAPIVAIRAVRENGSYEDAHLAFQVHVAGLDQDLWFQSPDGTDAGRAHLDGEHTRLMTAWRRLHLTGAVCAGLFEIPGLTLNLQAISAVSPIYTQTLAVGGWGGITRHGPVYDIHVLGLKEPLRRQATLAFALDDLKAEREALLSAWADWVHPQAFPTAV